MAQICLITAATASVNGLGESFAPPDNEETITAPLSFQRFLPVVNK